MRKFILSVSFLLTSFTTLAFSLFLLQYLFDAKNNFLFNKKNYQMYSALPSNSKVAKASVISLNVRVEVVEKFLKTYRSPLIPYTDFMIKTSDKYDLDYRLLPAMAMQESNLCKKAPPGSYNCWGYGIYGGKVLSFSGYQQAIEAVARGLARDYKAYGLKTPREIMVKYTPSNNGVWALNIERFMEQLNL